MQRRKPYANLRSTKWLLGAGTPKHVAMSMRRLGLGLCVGFVLVMLLSRTFFDDTHFGDDEDSFSFSLSMSQMNEFPNISQIHLKTLCDIDFDAILVLGGGVPVSETKPPVWVQTRAQAASKIYHCVSSRKNPYIVTLSGGSAHAEQLLKDNGLPVWESASTAAYLINECNIPPLQIVMETSSYDTIGNAYFARTSVTDVRAWRNLLVITSKSHMARTKAIFNWVFQLPSISTDSSSSSASSSGYVLSFLSTDDTGLSYEEVIARRERERKSLRNILQLQQSSKIGSLAELQNWLQTEHVLYAAKLLDSPGEQLPPALRKSYGFHKG